MDTKHLNTILNKLHDNLFVDDYLWVKSACLEKQKIETNRAVEITPADKMYNDRINEIHSSNPSWINEWEADFLESNIILRHYTEEQIVIINRLWGKLNKWR